MSRAREADDFLPRADETAGLCAVVGRGEGREEKKRSL